MKRNFIWQIVIAFALAVITGIIFKENAKYVQPLGDLFLRLIKFIIVPLVLSTIIISVTIAGDVKKHIRLCGKNITFNFVTCFFDITKGFIASFAYFMFTVVDII